MAQFRYKPLPGVIEFARDVLNTPEGTKDPVITSVEFCPDSDETLHCITRPDNKKIMIQAENGPKNTGNHEPVTPNQWF